MTDSTHETLPRMRLRQKTEMAQRGKIDQFAWLGGAVLGAMLIALVLTLAASGEWWWPALLGVGVGVLASAAIPAKRKLRMTLRRARAAEERLDAIFQGATIGLLSVTVQGEICAANHQIAQMLRRSSESLVGSTMEKLFLDAFTFQSISTLDEPAECRMLRADGLHFWARLTTFAALRDKLFVAVEDISDNRALRDTLSRCSTHDSLTDLVNRREIERRLEALLVNTQQMDVRHTLCFLDIDEFKLLNDACSHAAGDKVLRMVATALSNELSPPGWVGRLGGDEFIVLFEFVPLENGLQ